MNDVPLQDRFLAKLSKQQDGCWLWQGAKTAKDGYGQIWVDGRTQLAHRISVELDGRTIPAGLVCDHLCCNKLCVNPAHIAITTYRENTLRGPARQRHQQWLLTITHCPKGHPYTPANTLISSRGSKACRTCTRDRCTAKRRARGAAEHPTRRKPPLFSAEEARP